VRGLKESEQSLKNWCDLADLEKSKTEELAPTVLEALCDDLNTPKVIAELHALHNGKQADILAGSLRALGVSHRPARRVSVDAAKVNGLIDLRNAARSNKDFKESDRIRDELAAMGVVLKDSKDGTTWEVAR
jgi:cysteinyl-tRNA synthetase